MKVSKKKELGQYFTVSEDIQRYIFDKVQNKKSKLLEPSMGAGHLLIKFKEYDDNYPMLCFEIDAGITPLFAPNIHQNIVYDDFMKQKLKEKFRTIVGNPPYVKQKGAPNLYLSFVQKCFEALAEDGEMIFIVPSDFIRQTRASTIIQQMHAHGTFTDFWFPHDENLFTNASIDVVVFRYQKGDLSFFSPHDTRPTILNGQGSYYNVVHGIILFDHQAPCPNDPDTLLGDLFHVYVGIVSGKDDVFKVPFGNIMVLQDKDKVSNFIYIEQYPTEIDVINNHLQKHRQSLITRKIKKFDDNNWFKWGAPRNIRHIRRMWGRPCIYIRNMTRKAEVAFAGTVQYFGGALLCLVPKEDTTEHLVISVVSYLNTDAFRKRHTYAGRFKIGQKQLCCVPLYKTADVKS